MNKTKRSVENIIKELKKNPRFEENMEAYEKFFKKVKEFPERR